MPKRFIRTKENFRCLQCGTFVEGNGYTNHCPHCLWSRHVDINPGDRAASCSGMMEPIDLSITGGKSSIRHRCRACGFERNNKIDPADDKEVLISLANFMPSRVQ
jgi:rubrerythrin